MTARRWRTAAIVCAVINIVAAGAPMLISAGASLFLIPSSCDEPVMLAISMMNVLSALSMAAAAVMLLLGVIRAESSLKMLGWGWIVCAASMLVARAATALMQLSVTNPDAEYSAVTVAFYIVQALLTAAVGICFLKIPRKKPITALSVLCLVAAVLPTVLTTLGGERLGEMSAEVLTGYILLILYGLVLTAAQYCIALFTGFTLDE